MAIGAPSGRDRHTRVEHDLVSTSNPSTTAHGGGRLDPVAVNGTIGLPPPLVAATSMTREAFSPIFDHCFDRVYAYVTRRVEDRATCERVVAEVLAINLHLLVDGGDEKRIARALKASSDEQIEVEKSSRLSTRAAGG